MTNRELLVNSFVGLCHTRMMELAQASGRDAAKPQRQRYHGVVHPSEVNTGATRVYKCLGLENPRDLETIRMACSAHDVVQEATSVVGKSGFLVRQRCRGENEKKNAHWASETLRELRIRFGFDSVSDSEIQDVSVAIQWTIPAWDSTLGTMIQPHLHEALKSGQWTSVPLCVAMGDLLACGHRPDVFLRSSDELIVEEQIGVDLMLAEAKTQDDIPAGRAAAALKILQDWDCSQIGFVQGRKMAFEIEADMVPERQRNALQSRINKFDESIYRAKLRISARQNLGFFAYASAVGFQRIPTC